MAQFWQRRIRWLHDLRRDYEPGATALPAITTNATLAAFTTSRAAATAAPAAATTSLALAATADANLAAALRSGGQL